MGSESSSKKARLLAAIPSDRYTLNCNDSKPPRAGDRVVLDQGTVSSDGLPMCLVYFDRDDGSIGYEALCFEMELGPDL